MFGWIKNGLETVADRLEMGIERQARRIFLFVLWAALMGVGLSLAIPGRLLPFHRLGRSFPGLCFSPWAVFWFSCRLGGLAFNEEVVITLRSCIFRLLTIIFRGAVMSLKKTVEEKAREVGKALMDKKNQAKVKAEIGKRLAQGREQLVKLEAKLKDRKPGRP